MDLITFLAFWTVGTTLLALACWLGDTLHKEDQYLAEVYDQERTR